jgi:hypothetical protein
MTKTSFKTLLLLCVLQPGLLQSAWPLYSWHNNGLDYQTNCKRITTIHSLQRPLLTAYYCLAHGANLPKAINAIQKRLATFHTQLLQDEQNALLAIKNKFNMSDTLWQEYLNDLATLKQEYTTSMQQAHPNIIHDPTIDPEVMDIITLLLTKNKINPHSIHLTTLPKSERNAIDAQVVEYVQPLTDADHNLYIDSTYIPCTMELSPVLETLPTPIQISSCAHEIEHLVQHHSLTTLLLFEYLKHHYDIDRATVQQSAEYHVLQGIHEQQAEIFPAIQNPHIARCFTLMRSRDYYPRYLYENHFYTLSTIALLWKVNQNLTILQQKCCRSFFICD